jgi:aspyridone synthetase trans-acting enoyl reductase
MVPVPRIASDEVLVHTVAVALKPIRPQAIGSVDHGGCHLGSGYGWNFVRVRSGVEAQSHLEVGDRVCGFAFGANPGNPHNGAFGQYVAATARLCVRLPDDVDFATAASFPMGIFTAGFVFRSLGLEMKLLDGPTHNKREEFVLVHGGATATGTFTTQLLCKVGYKVIATCSPCSFELAKSRGAQATFDYNSSTVSEEIREYTRNNLHLVLDCIGNSDTMTLC